LNAAESAAYPYAGVEPSRHDEIIGRFNLRLALVHILFAISAMH